MLVQRLFNSTTSSLNAYPPFALYYTSCEFAPSFHLLTLSLSLFQSLGLFLRYSSFVIFAFPHCAIYLFFGNCFHSKLSLRSASNVDQSRGSDQSISQWWAAGQGQKIGHEQNRPPVYQWLMKSPVALSAKSNQRGLDPANRWSGARITEIRRER